MALVWVAVLPVIVAVLPGYAVHRLLSDIDFGEDG